MAGTGLAGLIPAGVVSELLAGCGSSGAAQGLFTGHQMAVIAEATARLIPGPLDDPTEVGHPGAREANVTGYIVTLLGAASYQPARVFAGGPFSDRAGNGVDEMTHFIAPNPALYANWRARLVRLHKVYLDGISAIDQAARKRGAGNFLHLTRTAKDQVLADNPAVSNLPSAYDGFTDLLFEHAIEGMYSIPEYGGNKNLVGWKDIGFPGDVQPRGYSDAEVSSPIDMKPYSPSPAVAKVIELLESTAPKELPPAAPPPQSGG